MGRDSGRLVGIGLRAEVDLIAFLVVSLLGMRSFGEIYVRVNALVRICSGRSAVVGPYRDDRPPKRGVFPRNEPQTDAVRIARLRLSKERPKRRRSAASVGLCH